MDGQSIIKQNRDFKLLDSYDIEKINSSDMSVFHSDINASTHTKSLNIYQNTNVSPQTNILNEYINNELQKIHLERLLLTYQLLTILMDHLSYHYHSQQANNRP